jgi:hypothetical protein
MDIELAKHNPNWRQYTKPSSKEVNMHEYSEWVPRNILYFAGFIEELFECKTKEDAFQMIKDADFFLKNLEGARLRGGVTNEFNRLFSDDDSSDWDNDREDDKLDSLKVE